jgi:hypothetical protein
MLADQIAGVDAEKADARLENANKNKLGGSRLHEQRPRRLAECSPRTDDIVDWLTPACT